MLQAVAPFLRFLSSGLRSDALAYSAVQDHAPEAFHHFVATSLADYLPAGDFLTGSFSRVDLLICVAPGYLLSEFTEPSGHPGVPSEVALDGRRPRCGVDLLS